MKTLRKRLVILAAVAAMNVNSARADQPHMEAALEHLRAARAELRAALPNKGGWRDRAIANIDRAIAKTERGIASAPLRQSELASKCTELLPQGYLTAGVEGSQKLQSSSSPNEHLANSLRIALTVAGQRPPASWLLSRTIGAPTINPLSSSVESLFSPCAGPQD